MAMRWRTLLRALVLVIFVSNPVEAKDLYKILGVDKNASQRDIQKAFHRLSLKYHPDKNPDKNAQAKFSEINNAYEVLSDEDKKKNYDLFGDEQGRPTSEGPGHSNSGGYTGFQNSGQGSGWTYYTYKSSSKDGASNRYRYESSDDMGGGIFNFPYGRASGSQGQSSSFSFGGGSSYFGSLFNNFFSSAWGDDQKRGSQYTSYSQSNSGKSKKSFQGASGSDGGQSNQQSSSSEQFTSKNFKKKVLDQHHTSAVLFTPDVHGSSQDKLQLLEQVSAALQGSVQVGIVDCKRHTSLCTDQKMWPLKGPKLVLFSVRGKGELIPLAYTGEWTFKDLKNYFYEVLPKFSRHIKAEDFNDEIAVESSSPRVVLLTRKRETPALWRALAGYFYGRIIFYDVQIDYDHEDMARKLGVSSIPAIIGVFEYGETLALSILQQHNSMEELAALIDDFEGKCKAAGSRKSKGELPLLTKKNFKAVCSQGSPICMIGVYRSRNAKDKLNQILKEISQKSLTRREQRVGLKPVSYVLLDGAKQSAFLSSFGGSSLKQSDIVLISYKPKKSTYALYHGPINLERIENFVIEVVNGNVQLKQLQRDPVLL